MAEKESVLGKKVGGPTAEEVTVEREESGIRAAIDEALKGEEAEATQTKKGEEEKDEVKAADEQDAGEDQPEGTQSDDAGDDEEAASSERDEHRETGDDEGGGGKSEQEAGSLEPPAHWSLDHQELFRRQPEEVQQWMLDRHKDMEGDYTRKQQEIAPLRRSVDKWDAYLQQIGVTPDIAFDYLMEAERLLRSGTPEQKRQALTKIANDYGINLEAPRANGEDTDEYEDPTIRKVVEPLQQEIGQLKSTLQTREQQDQAVQAEEAAKRVQDFKEAKTDDGKLAHPYYDEVEQDMIKLAQADIRSGTQPDLEDLYNRAIWSNPTVREKLLAAQRHAAAKEEQKRRQEKAKKAERASSSVTGSQSGETEQPTKLRDQIEQAWG